MFVNIKISLKHFDVVIFALLSFPCDLQVLALVFVRKLLDFFFTKRELSWLDDLMPESKKKKEDDKKKKAREKLVILPPSFFMMQ